MHDAQACGITRSLKNDAAAIIAIVALMPDICVASIRKPPAPMKPVHAMILRVRTSFPVRRLMYGVLMPQKSDPSPLKNNGKTAYAALCAGVSL